MPFVTLFVDIDCGSLPNLEHGTIEIQDKRTTHGARALYSCHENYTLIGHERRVCSDGGVWSETQPQCLFDWCPNPPEIHGGIVTTSGHRAGDTATYSCQAGFILFGSGVSHCLQFLSKAFDYLENYISWEDNLI